MDTVRGPASVAWTDGERFELEVEIPTNMTGIVSVPDRGSEPRVDGGNADEVADVTVERAGGARGGDRWRCTVGPGTYAFGS